MKVSKLVVADFALSVAGFMLAGAAFLTLGPALETRYFPVYSKFKIVDLTETSDGGSEVTFSFYKRRSCAPSGINWFIGDPDGAYRQTELISARPTTIANNRPVGSHVSIPYKVDVAPDVLRARGFASIYSNCHPFWVTRSVIYP